MTKKMHDDLNLDALFAAEKRHGLDPSDALMASILGDAADQQAARVVTPTVVKQSFWKTALAELGGWKSVATFASFACFGIFIGYASPDAVLSGFGSDLASTDGYGFTDSFSLESEFEISLLEG